ncbi:rhodanese-like domain-containing protein [Petrimonas sulfuriphila]|uniref:rhodanese-like domain-containing protein n=1 Tax=Petrimonas sulfuriphila TaxID=285070 RepID=UPI0032497B3D
MAVFSFLKNHKSQIQSLNPADFKTIIAGKDVQLIDVRTAQEYAQGTINRARLMDVSSMDFEQEIEKLDKSCPVAVFCHSGARSMYAAKVLVKKGFPAIYNLRGGIVFWK